MAALHDGSPANLLNQKYAITTPGLRFSDISNLLAADASDKHRSVFIVDGEELALEKCSPMNSNQVIKLISSSKKL